MILKEVMMSDFFNLIEKTEDFDEKEWLKDPKNMLLLELFIAEREARKNGKRKTEDCHKFEANLMENLIRLRDELWNHTYKPSRGAVHVIKEPVTREIFAAPFRDRVVHHWIVAQLSKWWEPRFSYSSCSCRKGKGTSFGIELLRRRIRQASQNFARRYAVVKLDIRGYFMHIRRDILFDRVKWGLDRQFEGHHDDKRYKMLLHAAREVIFDEPCIGAIMQGEYEDWRNVPMDKSLFAAAPLCGIVIGNLTSQFFSNIYLDALDRYITMTLGYKYYVRYVDDFCIVVPESEVEKVLADVPAINTFLNGLGAELNRRKTKVFKMGQGVPFLGMVVRGNTIMPGKRITKNFYKNVRKVEMGVKDVDTVTSYLGMLMHYDAGKVCEKVFDSVGWEYKKF